MFRFDQVVELGDFEDGGGFPARFLADVAYPADLATRLAQERDARSPTPSEPAPDAADGKPP